MENEILKLSRQSNSLEISRLLDLPLSEVESTLVDHYYNSTWKISKKNLLAACERIYNESPVIIAADLSISDITLKHYFDKCSLYNNKRGQIAASPIINETEVCKDYLEGESIINLCAKYKLTKSKIRSILDSHDISHDKVTFDDSLFDIIDSEEKAYWLGFFYADGAVSSTNNTLEISLKALDVEHLYKLKSFFKAKASLRIELDKIKRCRFNLQSKHFKERLIELGCVPNKSLILKFPSEDQVPTEFIIPFMRGYYDGDGVFSYTYSNKVLGTIIPNGGLLGTENFVKSWQSHFPELLNNTIMVANSDGDGRCKQLGWGKHDTIYVLDILYKDASIYLERKYQRYLFFKNNNFAVQKSDFLDNDRAISEKAKQWIKDYFGIDYDSEQANAEITDNINELSVS